MASRSPTWVFKLLAFLVVIQVHVLVLAGLLLSGPLERSAPLAASQPIMVALVAPPAPPSPLPVEQMSPPKPVPGSKPETVTRPVPKPTPKPAPRPKPKPVSKPTLRPEPEPAPQPAPVPADSTPAAHQPSAPTRPAPAPHATPSAIPVTAPIFHADYLCPRHRGDGQLFWNDNPIPEAELPDRLRAAATRNPQVELHLRADKATAYEILARVMATAQHHVSTMV